MKTLLIIAVCLVSADAYAQVLTGAIIAGSLRETANSIVANAGEQARATANEAAARLTTIAAELEKSLGDQVGKPINELNSTLKVQIDRALVALREAQDFIGNLIKCATADANLLLRSFNSTFTNNISNISFWRQREPIVYGIEKLNSGTSYGYRVKSKSIISLIGSNFTVNKNCKPIVTISNMEDPNIKINARIISHDQQKFTVSTDVFNTVGLYEIRVEFYSRYILGCFDMKSVRAFIAILPEPIFKLTYIITPVCIENEVVQFNAGRLDDTNDSCDGDKFPELVGVLPEGLKYISHQWNPESVIGEKIVDQYLGGTSVRIKYRLPKPECVCYLVGCQRIGGRSWVHGSLTIFGSRQITVNGQPIVGSVPDLTFSQTKSISVPEPSANGRSITRWVVSVSAVDPEGKRIDIPPLSGDSILTNAANGISFIWEPTTKTLSVSTPSFGCM